MCDCSLALKPCDLNASCDISTSFPVLFHAHRQVAHALLTRPPLIRGRSPFTVRLECVMHAASVHPEPGSNSLIIVYPLSFHSVNIFSQSNSICSITFSSSFSSKEFSSSFFVCKANFLASSLFNFQRSVAHPSRGQPC